MPLPTCKVCDEGTLETRKIARMGPVVVFIGWVLVIPSLLGVAGAGLGAVTSLVGGAAGAAGAAELESTRHERMEAEFSDRFAAAGLPDSLLGVMVDDPAFVGENETRDLGLGPEQRRLVSEAQNAILGDQLGAAGGGAAAAAAGGLGFIFFVIMGVMSLVGGLIGWLLVMKKRVLQCNRCAATVAAG
jgi:hypothetical protein